MGNQYSEELPNKKGQMGFGYFIWILDLKMNILVSKIFKVATKIANMVAIEECQNNQFGCP